MDTYKGMIVKVLLDNGTTRMFMDQKIVAKHRFRLQKLERSIAVRNVDGIHNSTEAITH